MHHVAKISAAIFDELPWISRVTVEYLGRRDLRISLWLPWWAFLTFGWLRRRLEQRIHLLLPSLLAEAERVELRIA